MTHLRLLTSLGALAAVAALAACTADEENSDDFVVRRTSYAVAPGTQIVISGRQFAFLADEATTGAGGTELNDDGERMDSVVVVVDAPSQTQTNLRVAALDMAWLGSDLYLVVDEAIDGPNWNPGLDVDEIVLLHWKSGMAAPELLEVLTDGTDRKIVAVGNQLYFSAKLAVAPGALQSNVRMVTMAAPTTVVPIMTTDAVSGLSPILVSEDEGLVRMVLDETIEMRNLNGDSDPTSDQFVLALMDGTLAVPVIQNVGKAMPSATAPFRSRMTGAHDWSVGFLVSETFQGPTNLNNPSLFSATWKPSQCTMLEADSDTLDDILHFLDYSSWSAAPSSNAPRNTGIVGSRKIAIANGFIATISPEAVLAPSLGEGTCDLNDDDDRLDNVVRYTQLVAEPTPILPQSDSAILHALFDVPGGTRGLGELEQRFVIVTSENQDGRDLNTDGLETFNLVGNVAPTTSGPLYDYTHRGAQAFVGASWMGEKLDRGTIFIALEEKVGGPGSINSSDMDNLDSMPTLADMSGANMVFPGVSVALDLDNAGIVMAKEWAFYRVSESDDNRDWNSDNDEDDYILFRTSTTQSVHSAVATLNSTARPALEVNTKESSPTVGVFILREDDAGNQDLNGDGDSDDYMIEYFTF